MLYTLYKFLKWFAQGAPDGEQALAKPKKKPEKKPEKKAPVQQPIELPDNVTVRQLAALLSARPPRRPQHAE